MFHRTNSKSRDLTIVSSERQRSRSVLWLRGVLDWSTSNTYPSGKSGHASGKFSPFPLILEIPSDSSFLMGQKPRPPRRNGTQAQHQLSPAFRPTRIGLLDFCADILCIKTALPLLGSMTKCIWRCTKSRSKYAPTVQTVSRTRFTILYHSSSGQDWKLPAG